MANHLDLEEQEQLDQLKHFWNTWGTLISSVLILVAGSLVAWNGYQYWQNRQASQAAALYDAVDVAARAGDQARMAQAFADLKAKYAGTTQASQAGLALAKTMVEAGNADGAKEALAWVAAQSGDDGLKALAKVRLASVLMDQKNYDDSSSCLEALLWSLKRSLQIARETFICCRISVRKLLRSMPRLISPSRTGWSTVVLWR